MAREDKVANVRYTALKAVREICRNVKDKNFEEKAKKCFSDMAADKDIDVSQIACKFEKEGREMY